MAQLDTDAIWLGVSNRKWRLSEATPGFYTESMMKELAKLQGGNREVFLFELSVKSSITMGYLAVWSNGNLKFIKTSPEGFVEITKEEYITTNLSHQLW